jgi:hypothetical protein
MTSDQQTAKPWVERRWAELDAKDTAQALQAGKSCAVMHGPNLLLDEPCTVAKHRFYCNLWVIQHTPYVKTRSSSTSTDFPKKQGSRSR